MNRIDRLTGTILLLQAHRGITAEHIAAHWEVSVRTVYRDLAALAEAGVPVTTGPAGGYALMDGYHVPPVMFTEDEASALFVSGEVTAHVADPSLKRSLGAALLKVRAVLTQERRDYLGRLKQSLAVHLGPGGRRPPDGQFILFQNAVLRRHCVVLDYDAGGRGTLTSRTVEPLGLIYYGSQWHLIAYCRLRRDFRDFRLDRVARATVLDQSFDGHAEFDMTTFLERQVGRDQLLPVTLIASARVLDRLRRELPGLPVDEYPLADGRVRLEVLGYCLEWMAAWLLSFGTEVLVETPAELRRMLSDLARGVATQYRQTP